MEIKAVESAEAADAAKDIAVEGLLRQVLDALLGTVPRGDVDASVGVGEGFGFWRGRFNWIGHDEGLLRVEWPGPSEPETTILAGFLGGLSAGDETALLIGRGKGAGVEAAPDAIAPAGNEAVDGIGKEGGNEAEEDGDGWPGKAQHAKSSKDSSGANEDHGVGGEGLADDEDGAGSAGGLSGLRVGSEEAGDSGGVGGDEAEAVLAIAADEPLDGGVAEAAVAVVDDEEAVAELGGKIGRSGLGWEGHYPKGCGLGVERCKRRGFAGAEAQSFFGGYRHD